MLEKHAPEMEILSFRRGFLYEISRRGVLTGRFYRSVFRQLGKTDFFKRVGQKRTLLDYLRSGRHTRTMQRVSSAE
jgi:hypothetical protein